MTTTTVKAPQQEDVSEIAGLERMLETLQKKRKRLYREQQWEAYLYCVRAELKVIAELRNYDRLAF